MKKSIHIIGAVVALGFSMVFSQGCSGVTRGRSAGELLDDAAITTKVKAAFVKDPAVKAHDVKVQTDHGTVQLSGMVDTFEERTRAELLAREVQGVSNVQNNITLKNQTSR